MVVKQSFDPMQGVSAAPQGNEILPVVFYVDDSKICFEKTQEVLGDYTQIKWFMNSLEAKESIMNAEQGQFHGAICDVNLGEEDNFEAGLYLASLLRDRFPQLPVYVVSQRDYREETEGKCISFYFKREFWEGGWRIFLDDVRKYFKTPMENAKHLVERAGKLEHIIRSGNKLRRKQNER